jgi:hypothetical protein
MDNSPERLDIIREMTEIAQKDSPWVWGFYPVSFGLQHKWVKNIKSNSMANNTMKYMRIETEARAALRERWNKPRLMPIIAIVVIFILVSIPAVITIRRRLNS